jgi:hypothetical protein
MGIIVRKHNPQNVNYNQLKGSGLFPRGPICMLKKCRPTSRPVPISPVPKSLNRQALSPLCARKQSLKDNKWELNGARYPDFNTLWVNIPNKAYTILKTNGRTS